MRELASRTGMRELTVRALLHSAALGDAGDAAAAALLAAEVDNDVLAARCSPDPVEKPFDVPPFHGEAVGP